jgi:hypothetical protein
MRRAHDDAHQVQTARRARNGGGAMLTRRSVTGGLVALGAALMLPGVIEQAQAWARWRAMGQERQITCICEAVAERTGCEASAWRSRYCRPGKWREARRLAMYTAHNLMPISRCRLAALFSTTFEEAQQALIEGRERRQSDHEFARLLTAVRDQITRRC